MEPRPINSRILQFAKAPVSGKVKTRLIPAIGAEAANELHQRLILHTLGNLTAQADTEVELWVSQSPELPFFQNLTQRYGVTLRQQQGQSLGDKMADAIEQTLLDVDAVIVVGSDCPAVDSDYLEQALTALAAGNDIVVGPAEDGGYVLIGLRRFNPRLMQDIDWGTDLVLQQTRERIAELGWAGHELPVLWDVDRPEDLQRFKRLQDADSRR